MFGLGAKTLIAYAEARLKIVKGYSGSAEVQLAAEPGRNQAQRRDEQQLLDDRHAERGQPDGDQRSDYHRARIDDVVGRDRPRRLRLVDERREERVERHDEHAAGDGDAEQRQQQRDRQWLPDEAADVQQHVMALGAPGAADQKRSWRGSASSPWRNSTGSAQLKVSPRLCW